MLQEEDIAPFYHSVLDPVKDALVSIEAAERKLQEAKEHLHMVTTAIKDQIGENTDLQDEVMTYLYWCSDKIPTTWIAEAFQMKTHLILQRVGKVFYLPYTCSSCGIPQQDVITSRTDLKEREKTERKGGGLSKTTTCPTCTARQNKQNWKRYEAEEAARRARLHELQTMPYAEYLQTPEWQARRQQHLRSSGYRCQICNTSLARLNVHHRTYERRGQEYFKDLVTLCEDCHTIFHQNGKLATS